MFDDMMEKVSDWEDDDEVRRYLIDLLDKKAFDRKGLIYGIGGMQSIPYLTREPIFLRSSLSSLQEKRAVRRNMHCMKKVEHMAPEVIAEKA